MSDNPTHGYASFDAYRKDNPAMSKAQAEALWEFFRRPSEVIVRQLDSATLNKQNLNDNGANKLGKTQNRSAKLSFFEFVVNAAKESAGKLISEEKPTIEKIAARLGKSATDPDVKYYYEVTYGGSYKKPTADDKGKAAENTHTEHQRWILIGVACTMFAMLLYPPFQMVLQQGTFGVGYGWIFSPPKPAATVNISLLVTQWIGTLLIGAVGYFYFKK